MSSRRPASSRTSPAARAASPSRRRRIVTGSESTSRVSSSASRSAGLIRTAVGRPLRVIVTRSWVASTCSTIEDSLLRASVSGIVSTTSLYRIACRHRAGLAPGALPFDATGPRWVTAASWAMSRRGRAALWRRTLHEARGDRLAGESQRSWPAGARQRTLSPARRWRMPGRERGERGAKVSFLVPSGIPSLNPLLNPSSLMRGWAPGPPHVCWGFLPCVCLTTPPPRRFGRWSGQAA